MIAKLGNCMSDIPRVVEIGDVCQESLAYILSSVGLDVETLGDEQVWIKSENYVPLKLEVVERDKMLKFQSSVGLKDAASTLDKLKLADELNRAIMVRFYVFSEGCLVGDYYLSYEHGVLTNQLILTCQLFQHIFTGVLREKFVPNCVLDV